MRIAFNNLRTRLTITFVGLILIPLVLVSAIIGMWGSTTLQEQAAELQDQVAQRVSIDLNAFINERQNELLMLTEVYGIDLMSQADQRNMLATLIKEQPSYFEISMVNASGREVIRVVDNTAITDKDLTSRAADPLFQEAMETGIVTFSSVYFNQTVRDRVFTIAIPIEDLYSGETGHVLMAVIRFQEVAEAVLRKLDLAEGEDVYVVDHDGIVVAHLSADLVYNETVFDLPEKHGRHTGLHGNDVILATETIQQGNLELIVVAEKPFSAATALATDLVQVAITITIAALVVFGGIVLFAVGRVVNPIVRLSRVAQVIQQGDLSAQADADRNDEIGNLGRAFNAMTAQLQASLLEEQRKQAYLESTVSAYSAFIEKVAGGDLTTQLQLNDGTPNEDDLYLLGDNLNAMVDNLASMAQQIREVAATVTSAAIEIQSASTQQVASITEQDAAVTQTLATLEEVRTTVVQTAERAQSVADMSQQSVDVSREGEDSVVDTMDSMTLIRQQVESIAETILALSGRTQQIGEIIDAVNAIADQSKLLALNASIEAARAGEEGRGFAVVAMEVRQLAEQSREATARVRDILGEIQQATNTAVMVTEEGSKGADAGMDLVGRAGESIRNLAATIESASQAAMQIAASTHQQTNGMDQLVSAMIQIKQASSQAAASTRQTEQSVHNLIDMAQQMEAAAALYELGKET